MSIFESKVSKFKGSVHSQLERLKLSKQLEQMEKQRQQMIDQNKLNEIQRHHQILNHLLGQSRYIQRKQDLYQEKLNLLKIQNKESANQLQDAEEFLLLRDASIKRLKRTLYALKMANNWNFVDVYTSITQRKRLTKAQAITLFKFNRLLKIDEKMAIAYLEETQWNLSEAMDVYYYDKLNYKHIWEWENEDNQWIPYLDHCTKQFDQLKVGGSYDFAIDQLNYRFLKTSKNSGSETNVVRKYKIIDMTPEESTCIMQYKIANRQGIDIFILLEYIYQITALSTIVTSILNRCGL